MKTFQLHANTKALLKTTVWASFALHFINDTRLVFNTCITFLVLNWTLEETCHRPIRQTLRYAHVCMGKFNCVSILPHMTPLTLLLILIITTEKKQTAWWKEWALLNSDIMLQLSLQYMVLSLLWLCYRKSHKITFLSRKFVSLVIIPLQLSQVCSP